MDVEDGGNDDDDDMDDNDVLMKGFGTEQPCLLYHP